MKCPADGTTTLVMAERQGVEIDYCPECRGVWLDRGELDKIIDKVAAAPSAAPAPAPAPVAAPAPMPAPPPPRYDDDRWDDDRYDDRRYKKKKKRSSFLEEMFDFG